MHNQESKKEHYGIVSYEIAVKLDAAGFKTKARVFYNAAQQYTYQEDEGVCAAPYLHELFEAITPPQQTDNNFLFGLSGAADIRYFCHISATKIFRSDNPADALAMAILFTLK